MSGGLTSLVSLQSWPGSSAPCTGCGWVSPSHCPGCLVVVCADCAVGHVCAE